MKHSAMVEEYNRFYRKKPTKWTSDERNQFAKDVIDNYLDGNQPELLLDIGCGNGHTISYLTARWSQTRFYGLDLSDEAIRIANERKLKKATFITGFLGEVEFQTRFDVIVVMGVAEHFEDPVAGLKQVKSLLLPGGIVYLEVPNCIAYPESEPVEGFRRLNVGSRQVEWHLYRESWEKIITDAGFRIVRSIVGPRVQTEFIWVVK